MLERVESIVRGYFQSSNVANKLDFLDGLRGLLAITVVVQHFLKLFGIKNDEYFVIFGAYGGYFGVPGFFILSAFLLTYRLLIDFDAAKNDTRVYVLRIIQYTIRRFFRIYLTYVMFLTILMGTPFRLKLDYNEAIFLRGVANSHLWTIPPEIQYYFLIPFLCIGIIKSGRYCYLATLSLFVSAFLIECFRPDSSKKEAATLYLINVFMKGSCIGIAYFKAKQNEAAVRAYFENHQNLKSSINYATIACIVVLLCYTSPYFHQTIGKSRYHIYLTSYLITALFVLLLLTANGIGGSNIILKFFQNFLLRSCGKFSFGIYLFHFPFMFVVSLVYLRVQMEYEIHVMAVMVVTFINVYLIGLAWFYTTENLFIKVANFICKKLEDIAYFRLNKSIV